MKTEKWGDETQEEFSSSPPRVDHEKKPLLLDGMWFYDVSPFLELLRKRTSR